MTHYNAAQANGRGLLDKAFSQCHQEAVLLLGLLEGLDHLDNENHQNSATALIQIAKERAETLVNSMERYDQEKVRAKA